MANQVLDTKVIRGRLQDMSQEAFAAIAHVDQSSVSYWETDRNSPSRAAAAWIEQYCAEKGIELAWKDAPAKVAAA